MDEVTLVNLLNKICEKNEDLTWKLNCKYSDGMGTSVMQLSLIQKATKKETATITFCMETGKISYGKYNGLIAFQPSTRLLDVLLDILHYESADHNSSRSPS